MLFSEGYLESQLGDPSRVVSFLGEWANSMEAIRHKSYIYLAGHENQIRFLRYTMFLQRSLCAQKLVFFQRIPLPRKLLR